MPVEVVWQLVLVNSAYKAHKVCHFVGLKKSHCYSLRFLRKAPTNKTGFLYVVDNNEVCENSMVYKFCSMLNWLPRAQLVELIDSFGSSVLYFLASDSFAAVIAQTCQVLLKLRAVYILPEFLLPRNYF